VDSQELEIILQRYHILKRIKQNDIIYYT